jgi:hypothetical protein
LQSDSRLHAWKDAFVLKLLQRNLLRILDKAFDFKEVLLWINLRNTTMVTNVVVFVVSNRRLWLLVAYPRLCG